MTTTSKIEEIAFVKMSRPHVVILGAGASIAATLPFNGDRLGKKLPSMANFVDTLGIQSILDAANVLHINRNFEDIYDEVFHDPNLKSTREDLESAVHTYFSDMQLPDEPTIYDHLVMSLRGKDIIATFNWDPFLRQAIQRNSSYGMATPTPLFLHGNVSAGYCACKKSIGSNGSNCSLCGKPFIPSKLLYPIKDKDYTSDFFISTQWDVLDQELRSAFMISIFGFGAPASDKSAVSLMQQAWGAWQQRNMEQIEVIDTKEASELRSTWSSFIHTHHYETHKTFNDSWLAKHPRRTGEAYIKQYLEIQYLEENKCPKFNTLGEMHEWYGKFQPAEEFASAESK